MKSDEVEIECSLVSSTVLAICVDVGGIKPVWIPRSQITDFCSPSNSVDGPGLSSIFVSEWFATEKGLV